jgi:Tol biopolymer transport system component
MNALARIVLAVVVLAVVAPPAQAAFPGRNGAIGFAVRSNSGDTPPFVEQIGLSAKRLMGGTAHDLVRCELTDGAPSGGDCTGRDYRSPSYSADGRRIVFDTGSRIGVMAATGGPITLLPAVTADDGDPAFSPDGTRIVFTGTNDRGTTDVYVRSTGGGPARAIVLDAGEPAWSSRNVIAYARSGNVYVARPNGSHRRWVTSGVSPDWAPTGRRLVLIRPLPRLTFDAPIGRIYTVDTRGRGLRRVGGASDALHPIWSPDGHWIAFEGSESGVLAKRLGSRTEARIVQETQFGSEGGSVVAFQPAWRPRVTG